MSPRKRAQLYQTEQRVLLVRLDRQCGLPGGSGFIPAPQRKIIFRGLHMRPHTVGMADVSAAMEFESFFVIAVAPRADTKSKCGELLIWN